MEDKIYEAPSKKRTVWAKKTYLSSLAFWRIAQSLSQFFNNHPSLLSGQIIGLRHFDRRRNTTEIKLVARRPASRRAIETAAV